MGQCDEWRRCICPITANKAMLFSGQPMFGTHDNICFLLFHSAHLRSLAVGTKSGYKFFSLSSVDKLEQIYECSKYYIIYKYILICCHFSDNAELYF